VNAFSQLDVGALILASGWYSTINDPTKSGAAGKVATASVPLSGDGEFEPVNILNGWLSGISSVSPNQDAAWDFLSWALSKENVPAFIEAGAPPAGRISTTENDEYIAELPYLPAVGEATQAGVPAPRIPEMGQIVTVLSQTISAMASDQLTLDEGMDKAQNDLLNILVQSGRYQG
jgi:ABC-type glycerol-3-phosphate transport system substrate-binding protein